MLSFCHHSPKHILPSSGCLLSPPHNTNFFGRQQRLSAQLNRCPHISGNDFRNSNTSCIWQNNWKKTHLNASEIYLNKTRFKKAASLLSKCKGLQKVHEKTELKHRITLVQNSLRCTSSFFLRHISRTSLKTHVQ